MRPHPAVSFALFAALAVGAVAPPPLPAAVRVQEPPKPPADDAAGQDARLAPASDMGQALLAARR